MRKIFVSFFLISFLIGFIPIGGTVLPDDIKWATKWSESLFEQAKKENKFIILDLEAVWCHWCHVMHKETYSSPSVISLLKEHYIPVRIDQDSRPDLSNRYKDYGWPATVIFNSKGEEIVKRSGYIQPELMKQLLQKVIDDPRPESDDIDDAEIVFISDQEMTDELREKLKENHYSSYDQRLGGLKLFQKFLDSDSVEYSLNIAAKKNIIEDEMAKKTLDAAIALIDPVWGGAYQYSTKSSWGSPHYEKLATIQARFMRIYSKAYEYYKDPKYLTAVKDIHRYLKDFLISPDGVFYVSQDADVIQGEHSKEYYLKDDSGRKSIGVPRIDTHIYSSHNGLVIDALVNAYNATGDKIYLDDAIHAAEWIIKHRSLGFNLQDNFRRIFSDITEPVTVIESLKWIVVNMSWLERGFKHDEKDDAGPFLADTLNMGRAFISLYGATSDKKWLKRAEQTARFMDRHFTSPVVGFATSEASCKVCAVRRPSRLVEENIELVRFANNLFLSTKYPLYREMANHAMRYLATPEIALRTLTEPGILIADMEMNGIKGLNQTETTKGF